MKIWMKPENIHINKSSFKYFILYYHTTKYCYIHPNVCFWTKKHLSILQKSYFVFHSRKKYTGHYVVYYAFKILISLCNAKNKVHIIWEQTTNRLVKTEVRMIFFIYVKRDIWISVHNEQNIYTICILFLFKLPW